MSRSASRVKKKLEERAMAKLKHHLESFAAAFIKVCDIDPREACLKADHVKNPDGTMGIVYRYEKYQEPAEKSNVADTHPDIQHLFHLSYGLLQARKAGDEESIKDGFEMLEQFMTKYAEQLGEEK